MTPEELSEAMLDKANENANNGNWLAAIVGSVLGNALKGTPRIRFDTGGYTGEWGQEGKLAILDEKEIVLDKYDTANLLDAVDIVRNLAP
jgi:hypothetical protein